MKFKLLKEEKGIALVMVLVLAAISLSIMAALIYMLVGGTKTSGIQKRYKTALEAGIGGGEVSYQFIALRGDATNQTAFINSLNALPLALNAAVTTPATCTTAAGCTGYATYTGLAAKLNLPTSCWSAACDRLLTINPFLPDPNTTYDMRFNLGTTTTYRVYAKIVDTVEGNSAGDEGLIKGGVVSANPGDVTVQSRPYLYTIEIDAENPNNVDERAKVSVLYQY
ncbi:MAG: hypothetical protein QMD07_03805 [Thermodesulfovibrionales bacterium]|nr:hypothetical protein [Thermodesulfovibrionales bacterium]